MKIFIYVKIMTQIYKNEYRKIWCDEYLIEIKLIF